MSVDVFGRQLMNSKEIHRGPAGVGFTLTNEGNFNIQNKRLCNIDPPIDSNDAVNLNTLNTVELKLREELRQMQNFCIQVIKHIESLNYKIKTLNQTVSFDNLTAIVQEIDDKNQK